METRADGSRIVHARAALEPLPRTTNEALVRGAARHPARTFLAERAGGGWRTLTYGEALRRARAVAQGLLDAGASPARPVVVAAENGIAHALVTLAAHEIGVATIPLAPTRLRDERAAARTIAVVRTFAPALAFVDDDAIAARFVGDAGLAIARDVAALERTPGDAVAACARAVDARSVAKYMLTSGTTGEPKAVTTTHGMIVSNQVAFAQVWRPDDEPPVLVDWLPWSHAFGGTKIVHFALHRGGTLYVDDGRPTACDFERTRANLRAIAPTAYFNVPRGYALLIAALEDDAALRARFFSRLRFAFNAAAALTPALAERFVRVRARETPRDVPLVGGWGLTETAPGATCVHACGAPAGAIGVPLPGVAIKLVPLDDRYELRVRGPNVTPGYANDPAATRAAFDDEGFLRTGDAAVFLDETNPDRGLRFAGRLAENFKLATGVWVETARLREAFLDAAAPDVAEVLLTGDDADDVCAIVFPEDGVRDDAALRARIARALASIAVGAGGRHERIARAIVAADAPSAVAGELTAKGTLNRAIARRRRAADVARLYATNAADDPRIVTPAAPLPAR